jgi:hypothetical protein
MAHVMIAELPLCHSLTCSFEPFRQLKWWTQVSVSQTTSRCSDPLCCIAGLSCRVTYTVDWQKDRVSWAMNGVPLLTKWASSTAGAGQQGTVKAAGRRTLMR